MAAGRLTDSAMLLLTSLEFVRHSKDRLAASRSRLAGMQRVLDRGRDNLESSAGCLGRARHTLEC